MNIGHKNSNSAIDIDFSSASDNILFDYGESFTIFCLSAGLIAILLLMGLLVKLIYILRSSTKTNLTADISRNGQIEDQKWTKSRSKMNRFETTCDLVYFEGGRGLDITPPNDLDITARDLGYGYVEYEIENCIFVRDDVRQYQNRFDCVLIGSSDSESYSDI